MDSSGNGLIRIDSIFAKHTLKLSPELRSVLERDRCLHNGIYYVIPVRQTFAYRALESGDYTLYARYLKEVTQDHEHSPEQLQEMLKTLDISSNIPPIKLNLYDHSKFYWLQDGIHRLSVMRFKRLFGLGVPIKLCNVEIYEATQEKIREALRKTVGRVHYNGWNNRLEFGYHSFDLFNMHIVGQRSPVKRLAKIRPHYDFTGKRVLDLGCNTGGMMLHVPEAAAAWGIDFDDTCIAAGELIRDYMNFMTDIRFFRRDLNDLSLPDFLASNGDYKPDIIFLLSIGSWCKSWPRLYKEALDTGATLLLETNNDMEGRPQLDLFRHFGAELTCIAENSDDDCTGNHGRKMYLVRRAGGLTPAN